MKITIIAAAIWIVCGVLAYGTENADWKWKSENKWAILEVSQRQVIGIILAYSISGPIGLILSLFSTNFAQHGITWKNWRT